MSENTNLSDALTIFQSGPNAPGWDNAACYLLSDSTPAAIRDQVEASISETVQKIYGFTFQENAYTQADEAVMTVRELSTQLGISEHQLMAWARWFETRYGEPVLRHTNRLHRIQ
ncbi:MAG: hypothetical protein V2J55_20305 [Candidatus Competibacteraceae bacterium]|nr:hypothetical protein [Candidatus Competibacteraceae bacterium]